MEIYNILAGALVLGVMLLIGSAVTFALIATERALRTARGRAAARRVLTMAAGACLLPALRASRVAPSVALREV